jgi:hypothetical protein
MDRTIKCLLGVIAASLVMLNLQLAGVSLVKDAHAEDSLSDLAFTIKLMARDVKDTKAELVAIRDGVDSVRITTYLLCTEVKGCREATLDIHKEFGVPSP